MSEIEEHAAEHERMTPTERHGRYEALLAGDVLPNELEAEGFVDAWGQTMGTPFFEQPPTALVQAVGDALGMSVAEVWERVGWHEQRQRKGLTMNDGTIFGVIEGRRYKMNVYSHAPGEWQDVEGADVICERLDGEAIPGDCNVRIIETESEYQALLDASVVQVWGSRGSPDEGGDHDVEVRFKSIDWWDLEGDRCDSGMIVRGTVVKNEVPDGVQV